MSFKKIDHTPADAGGSTHINVEHIAEVVFFDATTGPPSARVKYIGGGETRFEGESVEALRKIIDPSRRVRTIQAT